MRKLLRGLSSSLSHTVAQIFLTHPYPTNFGNGSTVVAARVCIISRVEQHISRPLADSHRSHWCLDCTGTARTAREPVVSDGAFTGPPTALVQTVQFSYAQVVWTSQISHQVRNLVRQKPTSTPCTNAPHFAEAVVDRG